MAEYKITVQGNGATATIPNGPRAQHVAAEIAKGFARAFPGQVIDLQRDGRSWQYYRGDRVERVVVQRLCSSDARKLLER